VLILIKRRIGIAKVITPFKNIKNEVIIVGDLYLKDVEETDINILNDYNNSLKRINSNGWVSEDRFVDLLNDWKKSIHDRLKVHFFPYWLMNNNSVIGLVIIKDNIEVDDTWKNFGGNISYVIMPSYREKGYGTKSLNLALKKCKELGIKTVLITCFDSNIGSIKIIENNYGRLRDICIDESNSKSNRKPIRRYLINVDESLKLYKDNKQKQK